MELKFLQRDYIEILARRGITELKQGQTIGDAMKETGSDPSLEEAYDIKHKVALSFIYHKKQLKKEKEELEKNNEYLRQEIDKLKQKNKNKKESSNNSDEEEFLQILQLFGVDNWYGYEMAIEEANNRGLNI